MAETLIQLEKDKKGNYGINFTTLFTMPAVAALFNHKEFGERFVQAIIDIKDYKSAYEARGLSYNDRVQAVMSVFPKDQHKLFQRKEFQAALDAYGEFLYDPLYETIRQNKRELVKVNKALEDTTPDDENAPKYNALLKAQEILFDKLNKYEGQKRDREKGLAASISDSRSGIEKMLNVPV